MTELKTKRSYKRGYPVAILVGLEENKAVLWNIFSRIIKPSAVVQLEGKRGEPKAVYNFHESIIKALKTTLREGVNSIILVSPARTSYSEQFSEHLTKHHVWLMQGSKKVTLSTIDGNASTLPQIAGLTRTPNFKGIIQKTTIEETENLLSLLEKRLSVHTKCEDILYSLKEIEDLIVYSKESNARAEHLMLTEKYLTENPQKSRLQRIIQIATNKGVRIRIIKTESPAGTRLTQLGGIVCLSRIE